MKTSERQIKSIEGAASRLSVNDDDRQPVVAIRRAVGRGPGRRQPTTPRQPSSSAGTPDTLKTDNGPPFNSEEFKNFSEYLGFRHQRVTPLWPKANAECERLMKTLAKIICTARIKQKN